MSAYDFNPDVCLQVFHGIAEDIPSGVSGKDLKTIVPKIKFTQELLSYIGNNIVFLMRKAIDGLWSNYQIADKLKYLGELEEKSPKSDAWRPTTGIADITPIIARNLLKRKKDLKAQIELIKEESAMITPYLKNISEQCHKQLEEIKSLEKEFLENRHISVSVE